MTPEGATEPVTGVLPLVWTGSQGMVGGILIAVSFRRGEGHDALPKILWPMAGAIVIGGGAALIGILAGA